MAPRLLAHLLLLYVRTADRAADAWRDLDARRADDGDRGDALSTAAIAVGLVLLAGIVVAILTTKGKAIAGNVCVNADPTTCR